MGKIHELFVWALSLVWLAGATPDIKMDPDPTSSSKRLIPPEFFKYHTVCNAFEGGTAFCILGGLVGGLGRSSVLERVKH